MSDNATNLETTNSVAAANENAPVDANKEFLKVENLKKYFVIEKSLFGKPLRYLKAVDDVSFTLEKGKTIGVVGESGCGKTTLGRTILKLYQSDGGKIYFEGHDLTNLSKKKMRAYRTDMQLVFQDPYSSLPPRMTVGSLIEEGVKVHKIVPKSELHDYVMDIMKKCGLQPQYFDRYPHEFSGGQRQRICIARALAVKPKLVICDEPVSALDVSIQAQIINLLKELQRDMGLTYVFISHDLSVVKYVTDSVLVMYLGNMMEKGNTDDIFREPLHPYTKALFSAVPVPNPDVKMNRIILEGDIPSPANPPKGCKFHTRCSQCMNVCKFVTPRYAEAKPEHFVACHLYDEEVMNNLASYDAQWEQMERDRIAAEQAEAEKKLKKGKHKAEKPQKNADKANDVHEE
ncbi:MAG: dipeptide ABC transporter ATP-binding protein [Pumilibacteraceae bacterium]|nr:dipeptide ABC transporter ATP-binding protein [Pumilibacteraceae bacterium]